MTRRLGGVAVVVAALAFAGTAGGAKPRMTLFSSAFTAGQPIPVRFSCDGANVSPPLAWRNPPAATKSFALWLDDPDAPGGTFTHWLAWGIPAKARALRANASPARQGTNSAGRSFYFGPCPPPDDGPHRYVFRLYALKKPLPLADGASLAQFKRALRGRALASATVTGTFDH